MPTQRVEVDEGVALEVDVWPGSTGPPFVLVHGLASNRRTWHAVARALNGWGREVACVDLRGHGLSDKPPDGYDFATLTGDIAAVLRATVGPSVVAGQSTGGNLAVDLAASEPGLVVGVAGVDGGALDLSRRWPDWDDCRVALAPPALAGTPAAAVEEMLRRAHPTWSSEGIAATMANLEVQPDGTVRARLHRDHHLAILRSLWEHRPAQVVAKLQVPVLLVLAGRGGDATADQPTAVGQLEGLHHVSVEWMHPADHDIHVQYPGELAARLHRAFPALG